MYLITKESPIPSRTFESRIEQCSRTLPCLSCTCVRSLEPEDHQGSDQSGESILKEEPAFAKYAIREGNQTDLHNKALSICAGYWKLPYQASKEEAALKCIPNFQHEHKQDGRQKISMSNNANGQEDYLRYCKGRAPLLLENIETNATIAVNIGVENFCPKGNLSRICIHSHPKSLHKTQPTDWASVCRIQLQCQDMSNC